MEAYIKLKLYENGDYDDTDTIEHYHHLDDFETVNKSGTVDQMSRFQEGTKFRLKKSPKTYEVKKVFVQNSRELEIDVECDLVK